jgi:GNAT superfamily N-acetyltransferase
MPQSVLTPLPPTRIATPYDLEALSSLIEAAYRGPESQTGWTSEAHLLDGQRMTHAQLLDAITKPDGVMLLVEGPGGAAVGCAGLSRTPEGAEFGKFAVRPALQNAGLGRQLLAACEDWLARAWGGGLMTMTVIQGRPELSAYYERRGYRPTGQTVALLDLHTAPGWTKGRDLRLDVLAKAIEPFQAPS